jgi:hypothetical protein
VDGEFVNMTSGRIYHKYDRYLNDTTLTVDDIRKEREARIDPQRPHANPLLPTLHIGMDFNIDKMAAIVHIITPTGPHAIDELVGLRDTEQMIEVIKERYHDFTNISVYPDSSGKNRSHASVLAETDIIMLKQAGFAVVYDTKNPPVKDRINSMNQLFCIKDGVRKYRVNARTCPQYVQSLEQQVYDDFGQPDKQEGWDHACDAGGYFVWQKFPIIRYQTGGLRLSGLY